MLNCTSHEVGGVLIITFEESSPGTDDRSSTHRQTLYNTIQTRDDPRFAVDLTAVEYMSSADIGFLISIKRRIDARKGALVLFGMNDDIQTTLSMMKLLPIFRLAADLPEAIAILPATQL